MIAWESFNLGPHYSESYFVQVEVSHETAGVGILDIIRARADGYEDIERTFDIYIPRRDPSRSSRLTPGWSDIPWSCGGAEMTLDYWEKDGLGTAQASSIMINPSLRYVRKRIQNLSKMFVPLGVIPAEVVLISTQQGLREALGRQDQFLGTGRPETLPTRIAVCRVDPGPQPQRRSPGPQQSVDSALSRGMKTFLEGRDGRDVARNSGSSA